MKFIPAILAPSFDKLREQVNRLQTSFDTFSVDIEDGIFAPARTYQIEDMLDGLNGWFDPVMEKLTFDIDLMVEDWQGSMAIIDKLSREVNVGTVFLHAQTLRNGKLPQNDEYNFAIGLVLDFEDSPMSLGRQYDLNTIPAIQIMTVRSGAQQQSINTDMLNKIGELKSLDYRNPIYVDGGVNENSLEDIIHHRNKPDCICIGSYLSHAGEDLDRRISYLKSLEKQDVTAETG